MAAPQPSLADLPAKFVKQPPAKSFSLNSRYMIINLLFNVWGEKAPRLKAGKLPPIDKAALEKMEHPFAGRLLRWRSAMKQIQSLANAVTFINPQDAYAHSLPSPTGVKATFRFVTTGFDNVERVFTQPRLSIPLNLDKRGRKAFVTPAADMNLSQIVAHDPRNAAIFDKLLTAPVLAVEVDEDDVEDGGDDE